jgi:AraC-like DNA-binding protein
MNLNLIEILTLLGALQGLGLSTLLFFSAKHQSLANKLLAVFITLFSLHILREVFQTHGYMDELDLLRVVSLTLSGYYAPLLYMYVNTLIGTVPKLQFKHFVHFGLAAFASLLFLVAALNGITDWPQMHQYPWLVILVNTVQIGIVLQSGVYIYLCFRLLKQYRQWLQENLSSVDQLGYQWLTQLLSGFVLLLLMWVVFFGANINFLNIRYASWVFDLFWLGISVFVYWIGYYSMLKPEIFTVQFKRTVTTRSSDVLDAQTIADYKDVLLQLFEQNKVYLDSELTLQQLAEHININDKKLSQVLNQGFKQTFYQLINQYRVEEVKRCLLLPQNSQSKLEVLAYEAGFKSASTFNRQFKQFTKMTPTAYRTAHIDT